MNMYVDIQFTVSVSLYLGLWESVKWMEKCRRIH